MDTLLATVDGIQHCGFGGFETIFCGGGGFGLAGAREKPAGGKTLEFGVPLLTKPTLNFDIC